MAFCTNCGEMVSDGTKFCPSCGAKQTPAAEQPVQQTPPVQEQPAQQQSYTPPAQQQSYQAPQQSYTPPAQGAQAAYAPTAPGAPRQKKPVNKKLLFIIGGAVLLAVIALVLILTLGGGKNKDPQGPAKYIGTWTCTKVSVYGMETDTAGVLDGDFTLEILDTGRYKMAYDGSHKNSFWEADEENITVKDGGNEWVGTWQADGTIFFDDLFDIGVGMIFTKTAGGAEEASGDPLLGKWICAQYAYQNQQPDDASSLFQTGCTVTFSDKKCKIVADDFEEEVKWKQNGDEIELTGSKIFKSGFVLKDGKLTGEYGGSGVTLYFNKEGAAAPTGTAAEGGYVGHWNGTDMILAGTSMGDMYGEMLASVLYLDINEDGTASMCMVGETSTYTWAESAGGITLSMADGDLPATYADGKLSIKISTAEGDIEYSFEKGEPVAGAATASVSKYAGFWESVECIGPDENSKDVALSTIYSAEELAGMFTITLNTDGTANIFLVDTDNLGSWAEKESGVVFSLDDGTEFDIADVDGQLVFDMGDGNVIYYEQNAEKTAEILAADATATEGAPIPSKGGKVTISEVFRDFMETASTTLSFEMSEDAWTFNLYSPSNFYIYNVPTGEDTYSNTPQIILKAESNVERFDSASYENVAATDNRTIGGVDMKGRTYTSSGMEWTEYIGVTKSGLAVSIRITRIDISSGSDGDALLNSIRFE